MIVKVAFFLSALFLTLAQGEELIFDFTRVGEGQMPQGFSSVLGGTGKPGEWQVLRDEVPTAFPSLSGGGMKQRKSVLAQVSQDPVDERFPILVYTNLQVADFTFTTKVKCVSGEMEQMAGVVFRYKDEQNYYYVRASAKGNTFRFFKVVGGQRSAPIGPAIQIPSGVWHELKVQCKGNQISCFLNGEQVIPTMTDNSFSSGMVGFWTKSDSVSYFADAKLDYVPLEPLAKKLLAKAHAKYARVLGMRIYAKRPGSDALEVIASTRQEEIGKPGGTAEQNVWVKDSPYFGRIKPGVVVTLPLHDRNGEVVGVLRVEMKSFIGQTENNAVARALPIAKEIEFGILESKDLF